jgi:hypothetical protein
MPEPRSAPIVVLSPDQRSIYVWGGYNTNWPNSLHILDTSTWSWRCVPAVEKGRAGVPAIIYGQHIYCHGGAVMDGLLDISMSEETVSVIGVTGSPPRTEIVSGGMIAVGRYAFFFGGRGLGAKDKWTHLYALDLERKWWFIFPIRPDGKTVTVEDGCVANGVFMVPRMHSFGFGYSWKKRALIGFLGSPCEDPSPILILEIGEAVSVLNLREDMRDMLLWA